MNRFPLNSAVVAVLALAALAGCGTPQTKPAEMATPAETTPSASDATDAGAAVAPAAANEQVARKIPSGYRRVKRGGKEVYCRSVVTLGSRFAEQMCFTREQLEEIANRTESTMGDMERGRKVCVGIDGCGVN